MKITLKNTWLHFKKICIHKYWVAHYCFKAGLIWQGLMHDMSKFSWVEFWESVRYYQGDSSPINACKADKGYSLAWQHHKGRNPHHYEHWTDNYDSGTTCIEMPYNYLIEMVCDYIGAGRAYWGSKFTFKGEYEWWLNKLLVAKIHPNTGAYVTCLFKVLAKLESEGKNPEDYINAEVLKYLYDNYKRVNDLADSVIFDITSGEINWFGNKKVRIYTYD